MNARDYVKKLVSEGVSQTEIARRCKLSNGTITKILYSESNLQLDTIRKIATAYNYPISFFIEDQGQAIMFPAVHEGDSLYASPLQIRTVPLISCANGGPDTGIIWEDAYPIGASEEIECPPDLVDLHAYALRVSGDSMSPKYTEGMIIYVSPGITPINGDFVIARLKSGDTLIKRYRRTNGTIILESINQAYEPIITSLDQIIFISKITHSREK